jgi:hypothetical protein
VPDWPSTQTREAEVVQLRTALAEEANNREMMADELREAFADVELALEDRGWWRLTSQSQYEFSRTGLQRITDVSRVAMVVNPLLKRGVALRIAYVWGQGIEISARDPEVNTLVQDFLDDPGNRQALTGSQAHERVERTCASDGNLIIVCFTSPLTGRVQVRTILFDEIIDVITNPEDRNEPWFYLRQWSTVGLLPSGSGYGAAAAAHQVRRQYYPALGYQPATKVPAINGIPVAWDSPILHARVNDLDGWQWGIGDVYAALPWARMYSEFLVDWAKIARALSKFVWRLSGDRSSKARTAASRIMQATTDADQALRSGMPPGQLAGSGPGLNLDAIPKTGATLDSESGKPLAGMAASALGVPVTMLLADPGQTGARAVAETLDRPTELEMGLRREFHKNVHRRLLDYVIDQAVIAPQGPLKGRIQRAPGDRIEVELAGSIERTLDIVFPEMTQQDPEKLITAIVAADSTGTLPPDEVARLLLQAIGVSDVDEIIEKMIDPVTGEFIPPSVSAGQAAVDAHNRGQDPAGLL